MKLAIAVGAAVREEKPGALLTGVADLEGLLVQAATVCTASSSSSSAVSGPEEATGGRLFRCGKRELRGSGGVCRAEWDEEVEVDGESLVRWAVRGKEEARVRVRLRVGDQVWAAELGVEELVEGKGEKEIALIKENDPEDVFLLSLGCSEKRADSDEYSDAAKSVSVSEEENIKAESVGDEENTDEDEFAPEEQVVGSYSYSFPDKNPANVFRYFIDENGNLSELVPEKRHNLLEERFFSEIPDGKQMHRNRPKHYKSQPITNSVGETSSRSMSVFANYDFSNDVVFQELDFGEDDQMTQIEPAKVEKISLLRHVPPDGQQYGSTSPLSNAKDVKNPTVDNTILKFPKEPSPLGESSTIQKLSLCARFKNFILNIFHIRIP